MRNLEYGSVNSLAGESQFVQELKKISLVLCQNRASVLLKGEKGTGKRQFAILVHLQGKNNPEDFFELNCRVYSKEETRHFLTLIAQLPSFDFLGKTVFISDVDSLAYELQEELDTTKEQLDTAKEQLDSTKEQLDSTKEQLDTANATISSQDAIIQKYKEKYGDI